MKKSKPLLRAQFYREESQKLREAALSEDNQKRRSILLAIAQSYAELARQIVAEVKAEALG